MLETLDLRKKIFKFRQEQHSKNLKFKKPFLTQIPKPQL
jgi:hypothetical protein